MVGIAPPRGVVAKQRADYVKIRAIGKGSFGSVFLAKNQKTGEQLVMKEVSLKGLSPKEQKATMNEVTVLKKLNHPNVIGYKESFSSGDVLCICMEWASGGDLGSLIASRKGNRIPEPQLLKIFYDLTSALAYCHHELHMLHRDIKPQNIFMGSDGSAKLGDFGLSKVLAASQALAATQCGTPLYMSPELCEGISYNRGADIWALGCILYELMSLSPPWVDQMGRAPVGISGLMRRIRSSTLNTAALRPHYSAELVALLESLLCKAPERRPALSSVLALPILSKLAPTPPPASVEAEHAASSRRPSSSTSTANSDAASSAASRPRISRASASSSAQPVGADAHVAAEMLQRSFRRRGSPLSPVSESPAGNKGPSIFQRPPSSGTPRGAPSRAATPRATPVVAARSSQQPAAPTAKPSEKPSSRPKAGVIGAAAAPLARPPPATPPSRPNTGGIAALYLNKAFVNLPAPNAAAAGERYPHHHGNAPQPHAHLHGQRRPIAPYVR